MFEWSRFAAAVAEGTAPPLDAVAALAELSDDAVLGMDQDESVAVIEIAQAALAALAAVQALGVEAFARREQERLDCHRADSIARHHSTLHITDAHEIVPAMLAPIFHLAPRTMANVLGETQFLVNDLPTTFALARADSNLLETLTVYGLGDRIPPERVYGNLVDAITAFRADRDATART